MTFESGSGPGVLAKRSSPYAPHHRVTLCEERMSISTTTRKRLWQRTGNRCAKCRCELHEDATELDDPSILGEECHIVGDKPNSARYDDPLPLDQRDEYSNLVVLCTRCHKIVDDQRETYTVEVLRQLKADHERWVRETLAGERDAAKEQDDLHFAQIVDEWCRLSDLERWENWGSYVLGSGQPKMSVEHHTALLELKKWLLGRVWPHRYPPLRAAFENYRRVLQDFLNKFDEHATPIGPGGGLLETEKFYKGGGFTRDSKYVLGPVFDYHVDLVQDLMVELTRAANYVCDRVRESVSPTFRLKDGLVLLSYSPDFMSVKTLRLEYRGGERVDQPYPGLEQFLTTRSGRDFRFGEGLPPQVPSP